MTGAGASIAHTGVFGLDDILGGGLPRNHIYVIEGTPGAGKTTLGLQFLLAGREQGESCLYVSLSETRNEIQAVVDSHGWVLDGIEIHELVASQELTAEADSTLFHPAEIELGETTGSIVEQIERVNPSRLVIDSLSEVRLLAQNSLRYRRQIVGLKQFLASRNCTALLLNDGSDESDQHLQTVCHGIVRLEHNAPIYGSDRRRLRVTKLRAVRFREGYHDFRIETGGLVVFPRLIAAEHQSDFVRESISSGLSGLDELLGGGLNRGTTALITGPAGTGKSAIVAQYASAAAGRGENVVMFTFDEGPGTLFARTEALGIPLRRHVLDGRVRVRQIDPAELSPGEFAHQVRRSIDHDGARMIVIDSLSGYFNAMPEERLLSVQLHELFSFLRQKGAVVLLTLPQHGFVGAGVEANIDVSYLADAVVLLRYFETAGEIRKAISVMKKRSGRHQTFIRQLAMDHQGLRIGPPLREFQGILTGLPSYAGASGELLRDREVPSDR